MNSNTVKITLQVDDKGTVKIKGAGDALDQMGTKGKAAGKSLEGMNTQTTKGGTELGKFTTASGNANKSLGQMTKGAGLLGTAMKGAMAYFSVKALANLGSDAIGVASSFETLGVSLKTVTGSSAAADKALSWITEFTAKTPYQLDSVADGFRKLTAYGLDATKYLGTLGDTASAMGKSLDGAVEMFADAAQGEFERLKEFGVRASVEGDNVTFKWMENGQQMETTAEKTQTGITTALDGVFAHFKGGMEEQSQTWSGMMSNLEDTTTLFQKKVMDSGPFVVMKSTLSEFVGYLSTVEGQMTMDQWAEDTGHAIVNAMEVATWAVEPLAFAVNGLGGAFDALKLGVAEAEEFLLDMYTSVPTWMLPESMEMSSVTIDALRQTIHQTKEEATADIIETSETIEGLHGKFDSLRGMIDKAGESGSKSIKSIGSEAAATAKTVSGVATSTAKSVTSTATDTAKTLTKTDSSYISDSHSIYKKGLQRRGELLTDWEQDQLDLQDDLVDEFEEMTGDQYEFERKAILKKAKMYEDAGADKVDVAEWAEGEIERINNEEEEDAADLFRKNAIAGDDFFAGLQAGYADNLEYARTWGQTGYDIARDFAQESGDVVGDVLFDAVKGDMDSLGDYWESFWDGMLQSMTSYIGQMVAEWATSALIDYGGSFLSDLITFHTGLVDLEDDELLAKLQKGEMVIPAKQADTIRSAISTGGISKDSYFNDVAGMVDMGSRAGSFGGWGPTTSSDIAATMANAAISQSIAGALTGFANYSSVMSQAKALSENFSVDMSMAKDFAMEQAIATGLSRAFTGFAGSFMGNIGMQSLGIADETFGIAGMSFSTPGVAQMVSAAAASLFGLGPVASMVVAAVSPALGLAVSGLADFMGLRDNEFALDSLEDAYGEIGGRQVSQMLGRSFGLTAQATSAYMGPVDDVWGYDPTTMENFVFARDDIEGFMSASMAEQVGRAYGTFGKSYADAVFGGMFGPKATTALAKSIVSDKWGFASYDTRESALSHLGLSDINAHNVARTKDVTPSYVDAVKDAQDAAKGMGEYGGGAGTSGHNVGGAQGSSTGTGGGYNDGDGGVTGLWTGGPVSPGYMYEINERGQELFLPGADGRILNAQETQEMLSTLKQIASGGGLNSDGAALYAIAKYCQKSMKIFDKWDHIGMPEVRA